MRRLLVLCGLLFGAASAHAEAPLRVRVDGQVAHPGARSVPAGTRLGAVTVAAGVTSRAFVLGAAWLQRDQLPAQRALKAGLRFDLTVLADRARLDNDELVAKLALQLRDALDAMPVTGRRIGPRLDPLALEVAQVNPRMADGDMLLYPVRPDTVRVVGAVVALCTLKHRPMAPARSYRGQCPLAAAADPDWLYVIEPDGAVMRRGVGPWNDEPPATVAPGAVVYVPLRARGLDPAFNEEMARFLATQLLPGLSP